MLEKINERDRCRTAASGREPDGEQGREMNGGGSKEQAGEKKFDGKQNIRRLIIVAGPSCAGKTTLINRLRKGELPLLQKNLKMLDLHGWYYKDAWQLKTFFAEGPIDLILHYDILRLMDKNIQSYDIDPVFHVLQTAREVMVLTLWECPETLLQRCRQRQWKNFCNLKKGKFRYFFKRFKRLNRKSGLYKNPKAMAQWYKRWFDFCLEVDSLQHVIVQSHNPEEILAFTPSAMGASPGFLQRVCLSSP